MTLLLSLAAQSGVYARPTGPRAIAEISTALVLLNAPSRAWAFVKYSPGSDNVCGELCEWDEPVPRAKKLETQEKYCETERGGCAEAFSFKCYGETVQVPATTPTLDGRAVCPVVQSLP